MTQNIVNHFAVSLNAAQWLKLCDALLNVTTLLDVLIRANASCDERWHEDTVLGHYLYLLRTHAAEGQQVIEEVQRAAVVQLLTETPGG